MKKQLSGVLGTCLLSTSSLLVGHQANQANQPKISDAQRQVLVKIQTASQASNWDGVLQGATQLVEGFPDSPYKARVEYFAMQAAGNEKNYDQQVIWGDRIIQGDPNDIVARVTLADAIAQHTRENDLDKDQNLKKAEDYANQSLTLLQNANTPPANAPVDAAQWPGFKQELIGQAHYALGASAELKKNFPDAQKEFQASVQAMPTNAVFLVRLAKADVENKQYDDAITNAQKVLDMPSAPEAVKNFATQEKQQATTLKGGTPAPAAK